MSRMNQACGPTGLSWLGRAGRVALVSCTLGLIFAPSHAAPAADPVDWYQWRGPEGNGISREKNLPVTWSPSGENVVWVNEDYGTRCTPIGFRGRLYFAARYMPETTEEGERLVCVDASTGEKVWEYSRNIFLTDAPAERVGWSSPVADPATGDIFWLGLGCEFSCHDGETGQVKWSIPLSEEYGMLSTYGGRTNFPIVFEDLVIVSGVSTQWGENAVPAHRFLAVDKRTGAPVWLTSTTPKPKDTTYSTPFLTNFNGEMALVVGAGDGKIHALQPRTGRPIWSYQASLRGIFTSPTVVDNIVYGGFHEQSAADTRVRGGLFAFDGRTRGEIPEEHLLWKIDGEEIGGGGPVVVDGRLYIVDLYGKFLVVDTATGEILFSKKVGRRPGSVIYGDGKIYITESTGMYWVFEPTEDGVEELARVRLNREEILAAPIIYRGRIYVTTTTKMFCIGQPDVAPVSDPLPPEPATQEPPVEEDRQIAHIQVAPVEAMLWPGQSTPYQVRAYNRLGQFLKVVDDARFSVEGGGQIGADGTYTAPQGTDHRAVYITAKVGEVSSTARARVIPDLPWNFDFEDKQVPITWIGAAYRHQPKEFNGENVLVKISTIPLGTRSQSWMGWTTLHDYTIEADLYSTENPDNGKRADMGLINQRYTLDLMGKGQLQIRSWTPRLELRFAKTIPFEWEANTWYRMKFQSENRDGKAWLRGKVWKRGEPEPEAWMIEGADAKPNIQGSPGMFGKSTDAEFYIDNVKVYYNN